MAEPRTEFKHNLRVQRDNYGDFIRVVQQDVIKYCSDQRPRIGQPVLPPEQDPPKLWLHVVLQTTSSSITLAIRVDNLYLVGFKTPAGVWWEFNNDIKPPGTHLISGSTFLGFSGHYSDLIGHQQLLETVMLGRAEMASAVDVLAEHGIKKQEERQGAQADPFALPKSKLAKLVIMICEGLRFHTVYGRVDKEFDHAAVKMNQREAKQVREWAKISDKVREWAVDPTAKFPELEEVGIKDKNDAARIVAIVKDKKVRG